MRTTVTLDDDLMAAAQDSTGLKEKSALLRAALTALVEREAARRLARLGGTETDLQASAQEAGGGRMILVDTSVWIDHLRRRDEILASLLEQGTVLAHPFVLGELALGNLARRDLVLNSLRRLPRASVAGEHEVMHFIEQQTLFGIGYIDAHLLAATRLTEGATFWSRDRRLQATAEETFIGRASISLSRNRSSRSLPGS